MRTNNVHQKSDLHGQRTNLYISRISKGFFSWGINYAHHFSDAEGSGHYGVRIRIGWFKIPT
jgi:hypothetical protein